MSEDQPNTSSLEKRIHTNTTIIITVTLAVIVLILITISSRKGMNKHYDF
jgi:hypothetical protein